MSTLTPELEPTRTDYFQRNRRWLQPLFGLALALAAPMVLTLFNQGAGGKSMPVPDWLWTMACGGAILGAFLVGLGAVFTDTISADILRVVMPGIALAMALTLAGQSITTTLLLVAAVCALIAVYGRRR